VDEDLLVVLAVLGHLHHVDALDVAEADFVEHFKHGLLRDVGEDERNAKGGLLRGELTEIERSHVV